MKVKEKPCKGTGKAKGYGCGKLTAYRRYGLGKMCCYADWLYSSPEGLKMIEMAKLKVSKPRIELEKAKQEKKESNSLSHWLDYTRQIVHGYVNKRDKGKPCISCGQQWNDTFQAGHRYNQKQFNAIRFDLDNIHGQCQHCNTYLEGNYNEYELRLPDRIGYFKNEFLKANAQLCKTRVKKWTRSELAEIRKEVKKLLKELE